MVTMTKNRVKKIILWVVFETDSKELKDEIEKFFQCLMDRKDGNLKWHFAKGVETIARITTHIAGSVITH